MRENYLGSSSEPTSLGPPRAFDTILYGGLAVGVLDGLFALIFYGLIMGVKPLRIFQSVAVGLLGRSSYEGGVSTFLVGVLLHFAVATCIAAVYYLLSLKLRVLINHAVISGLIYGIIAYFGMKNIVMPLSAIGRRSPLPSLGVLVVELVGHALLVGLPIALLARRSAIKPAERVEA